ncbi:hypothetical protein AC1031_012877 [Aphanomyces cochlioides]|nr:hypothetical protein AC1031_012877 [Aphanomyces cochlioides]
MSSSTSFTSAPLLDSSTCPQRNNQVIHDRFQDHPAQTDPSSILRAELDASWIPGEACDNALDLLKEHQTKYRRLMEPSEWKNLSVDAYATYFWNLRYLVRASEVFQRDDSVRSSLRMLLQGALKNGSPPSNSTVDETIRTCTSAFRTPDCYDAHPVTTSFPAQSTAPSFLPQVHAATSFQPIPAPGYATSALVMRLLRCIPLPNLPTTPIRIATRTMVRLQFVSTAALSATTSLHGNALLPVYNARADTILMLQLLIVDAIRLPMVPLPPQLAMLLPVNLVALRVALQVEATAIVTALSIAAMATRLLLIRGL